MNIYQNQYFTPATICQGMVRQSVRVWKPPPTLFDLSNFSN